MKLSERHIDGYERVVRGEEKDAGYVGFVAVHSTALGPACGGTRLWPYESEDAALQDALRLARAMTYKSAVAGNNLGGGKAVILADPAAKTEALLRAHGKLVDALDGQYITAEDMNINEGDLAMVRQETRWVGGLPRSAGSSGNPSPVTARGCYAGIRACLEEAFGSADPAGRNVVVQGVGAVGGALVDHLLDAGAHVSVCDINAERLHAFASSRNVQVLKEPNAALFEACDVLAPCARGPVVTPGNVAKFRCKIIAGSANNQLSTPDVAPALAARGVLYAPDYVINAGGIINIDVEFRPEGYDEAEALRRVDAIGETLRRVFARARDEQISTEVAAARMAEERLAEAAAKR